MSHPLAPSEDTPPAGESAMKKSSAKRIVLFVVGGLAALLIGVVALFVVAYFVLGYAIEKKVESDSRPGAIAKQLAAQDHGRESAEDVQVALSMADDVCAEDEAGLGKAVTATQQRIRAVGVKDMQSSTILITIMGGALERESTVGTSNCTQVANVWASELIKELEAEAGR